LAAILAQHHFALEHVDELILGLVPMALRRPRAGLERGEVHAELVEPDRIAQPLAEAAEHRLPMRLGIVAAGVDLEIGDVDLGHQTRSMMVAVPMPAPMHKVTRPVERSRRSSSSSNVPRIMAPVAPSGWPSAIAPPLTLTLSGESSNACR